MQRFRSTSVFERSSKGEGRADGVGNANLQRILLRALVAAKRSLLKRAAPFQNPDVSSRLSTRFFLSKTFRVLREICLCTSSRNDPTQMIAAFDERNVPPSFLSVNFVREEE